MLVFDTQILFSVLIRLDFLINRLLEHLNYRFSHAHCLDNYFKNTYFPQIPIL